MTRRSSWPLGYIHMCLTVSMSHFLLPSNTGLTLLSTGGRLCLWPGLFSYYLPPAPPPPLRHTVCLSLDVGVSLSPSGAQGWYSVGRHRPPVELSASCSRGIWTLHTSAPWSPAPRWSPSRAAGRREGEKKDVRRLWKVVSISINSHCHSTHVSSFFSYLFVFQFYFIHS